MTTASSEAWDEERGMFVFVHIPKTAGTTAKFILRNTFGLSHCDTSMTRTRPFGAAELVWARRVFPGLKSLCGHNLHNPALNLAGTGDHIIVSIVRDPVMRVVSNYQDSILRGRNRKPRPLMEYLKTPGPHHYANLQCHRLAGTTDIDAVKSVLSRNFAFIGLTERFNESMWLLNAVSPEPLDLRYCRCVVARNNEVKQRILADTELVAAIEEANSADRAMYEYVRNELFPAYVRKYGLPASAADTSYESFRTERQPRVVLSKMYNKLFFRQVMKFRNRIRGTSR